MSTDVVMTTPTPEKKSRKHKDKSDKKSSKKRARDDPADTPAKKPRTAGEDPASETVQVPSSVAAVAAPDAIASADSGSANCPIWRQTTSFYVPLSSIGQRYPLESVCAEHLSPLLLTYYAPLKGVLLSYSNARLSDSPRGSQPKPPVLAKSVDEYAVSFVWVMADFIILRPAKGVELEGRVNLVNESHMGLLVWNLFNASIDRKCLPKDWAWADAGTAAVNASTEGEEATATGAVTGDGHWTDARGNKIEGVIKFRVRDFDVQSGGKEDKGMISIEGTLLAEDEEKALEEEELAKIRRKMEGGARVAVRSYRDQLHAHVDRQMQQDGRPPETSSKTQKSKEKEKEGASKPKKSKKTKET